METSCPISRGSATDSRASLLRAHLLVAGLLLFPAVSALAERVGTLVAPPRAHSFGVRRVTSRQIGVFVRDAQLTAPAGIAVTLLASSDDPDDKDDDDEVTIVALDSETGRVFTNFGLLRAGFWDGRDSSIGPLWNPRDVAIDREGNVAVTDPGNNRVVLLHHDGSSLTAAREFPGYLEPTGITADGRGGFYVCDRRFNTVFHLDAETGARTTFGLEVAFDRPIAIATIPRGDTMARGKKRTVVIVDRDGKRIRSFGVSGSLRATREAESMSNEAAFDDVDIDYYGNVYAVDRAGHRMHKFRDDLFPLDSFGEEGTQEGMFQAPRGIAIHRKFGQVFVTESDGGQYLWVGTDVKGFEANEHDGTVTFSYVLTEESTMDFRIVSPEGSEIARLFSKARYSAGPQRGSWDGTSRGGTRVPSGEYLAEIRARATYASRSTYERKLVVPFTLGQSVVDP